ncbi:GNAT family acetyltransferase [Acinetobacter gandensis]|uniref:GNAT family acetyltransferase n=1 Tax=Acinetobacter gandensis TaxID=1443941 RepID=A0A1A7RCJ5_9GAMM|nr:GNAT family acetyltransferase [Acinetobacter gandensis]KAB0625119.1 GNAT family acetyltransferase [Acinetobacter gandensis]OBX29975.1 GNAT family acetyltransferase [Acinetobacter gandensis]
MFIIRPYLESDLDDVIALWELCGLTRPWNNPEIDIFRKLAQRDQLFLLAVKDNQLIATVMGGYDGHRGWVNYLAVHPNFQRNGVATALVQQLEKRLIALGCPKLQLLIRKDNIDVQSFYEQLGYDEIDVICLGKRLIQD